MDLQKVLSKRRQRCIANGNRVWLKTGTIEESAEMNIRVFLEPIFIIIHRKNPTDKTLKIKIKLKKDNDEGTDYVCICTEPPYAYLKEKSGDYYPIYLYGACYYPYIDKLNPRKVWKEVIRICASKGIKGRKKLGKDKYVFTMVLDN